MKIALLLSETANPQPSPKEGGNPSMDAVHRLNVSGGDKINTTSQSLRLRTVV
jgi:hypothetical protein